MTYKPLQVFLMLIILTTLTAAFSIQAGEVETETMPTLGDARNNISQAEYSQILKCIKQAQALYKSTDYLNISHYVSLNARNQTESLRWNVYVFQGRIKQVGVSVPGSSAWNKFMWLLNYGKYNLTYILIGTIQLYCAQFEKGGDWNRTEHFGPAIHNDVQQLVIDSINLAIITAGDDIMRSTSVIYDYLKRNSPGHWSVIIADPSAKYGYWTCMVSGAWFAFPAYKDYKWNYLGSYRIV